MYCPKANLAWQGTLSTSTFVVSLPTSRIKSINSKVQILSWKSCSTSSSVYNCAIVICFQILKLVPSTKLVLKYLKDNWASGTFLGHIKIVLILYSKSKQLGCVLKKFLSWDTFTSILGRLENYIHITFSNWSK